MSHKDVVLYINIPFCNSKCHFCYWVAKTPKSHLLAKTGTPMRDQYVEALNQQIRLESDKLRLAERNPKLIYFGGGTPGVLSHAEIDSIMQTLSKSVDLSSVVDITFESTPETLTPDKLQFLKNVGFTRISIGAQSLNDHVLQYIGRMHTEEQVEKAAEHAHRIGFKEINIDLIAGLPGESAEQFERSVLRSLQLPLNHMSIYTFRLSPQTKFYRDVEKRNQAKVDYALQSRLYTIAKNLICASGFDEYSFYYFSKNGTRSRVCMACFNLDMDWVGFGAGATSLINGEFTRNFAHLPTYNSNPTSKVHRAPMTEPIALNTLLANTLTTPEGVVYKKWLARGLSDLQIFTSDELAAASLHFLKSIGALEQDAKGFRICRDRLSEAYIRLTQVQSDWLFGKDLEKLPESYMAITDQFTPLMR